MRILQIIDSLETGGAERMAVSYANGLLELLEFSSLVTSRAEGPLLRQLNARVEYLHLQRRSTFDLKALLRLRSFVRKHKIDTVQAHSTSFLIAALLKVLCPEVRLIWHDHYGENLACRPYFALRKIIPIFFSGVVVVNNGLLKWVKEHLRVLNIIYLPNFPVPDPISDKTRLYGVEGKRIICIANLRHQKNHPLVLKVASMIKENYPEWTFHLIGKSFSDNYSNDFSNSILAMGLQETVFYYGVVDDIRNVILQSEIAILFSHSEGLPVALLEYGLYGKAVAVTAVGEISSIVKNSMNGMIFEPGNESAACNALKDLIVNPEKRLIYGTALQKTIYDSYSQDAILKKYVIWLKNK